MLREFGPQWVWPEGLQGLSGPSRPCWGTRSSPQSFWFLRLVSETTLHGMDTGQMW